jgi:hypothetical protein
MFKVKLTCGEAEVCGGVACALMLNEAGIPIKAVSVLDTLIMGMVPFGIDTPY